MKLKLWLIATLFLLASFSQAATERVLNLAAAQIVAATSSKTLVIARPTRSSCLVRNLDATLNVYIGPVPVNSTNGMLIKPGESFVIHSTVLWQVIASSGTPTVAVLDEY